MTRVVAGIIDNGWKLVDLDGEATRYEQFDPEYINVGVSGLVTGGGQRSAATLGMATLAHQVSGDARFLWAKAVLMDEHHYHENALV